MRSAIDLSPLFLLFLLAVARFSPVFVLPALTPFAWAPLMVRLAACGAVAVLAVSVAPAVAVPAALLPLGLALVCEFLLGLALAFALHMPFAALGFIGRQLDVQVGLGAAGLFAPGLVEPEALLGVVLTLGATALFFAFNIHHALVAGLVDSTTLAPLGSADGSAPVDALVIELGRTFIFGLLVVLPVVLGMLMLDIGVAYASRTMPQANVYFLALPLKIVAGFALLALSLRHAAPLAARAFERVFETWARVLVH